MPVKPIVGVSFALQSSLQAMTSIVLCALIQWLTYLNSRFGEVLFSISVLLSVRSFPPAPTQRIPELFIRSWMI